VRPFFKKNLAASLFFTLVCAAFFLPRLDAASDPFYVRVLVAENRKELTVSVKGRYTIRVLPSRKVARQAQKMTSERLIATPRGFKLGAQEWAAEGLLIEPASDRDLYLGQTRFRGQISVFKAPGGLYAVNRLDIERYLYGVLHHEVAPWWPMEALKAQAIAARTYAVYQVQQSKAAPYDLKSSTASQVYGGSTTERYRTRKAVDRTAGQVLVYEGKVFPAYFHATCGGVTAAASELWKIDLAPIGGGVKCGFCRISPHFYWQAKVPLSAIEDSLRTNNRAVGQVLRVELVSRTPSGRVGSVKITGTQSEAVVAAKDFRVWVGGDLMKSTDFTVEVKDDLAEFKGKGWGHGVGLCQWGTLGKALLGTSFKDILQFYYPGSALSKI
jgi:stage II sporulation protein D